MTLLAPPVVLIGNVFGFQCAAAKLIQETSYCKQTSVIVVQGILVQAVLSTPNGISGVTTDAGFMSSHPLINRTITPV